MRRSRAIVLAAATLLCSCASADPRDGTRYLRLVNRAHDSIATLSIAAAGTGAFREVVLGEPLRGGGDSATVELPAQDCRYDFRLGFRNGRALAYQDVDVCRITGLRIGPLPPVAGETRGLAPADE